MEKEFVPYAEALELRDVGFDEPCICGYSKNTEQLETYSRFLVTKDSFTVDAPTFSQAFRFFREFREYEDWCIESWIQPYLSDEPRQHEAFYWRRGEKVSVGVFSTHDEAQLNLLRKLIEIVKTKQ